MKEHPDKDVQAAIVHLCDALCTWERNTGRQSVLILREEGGFHYRAVSGKPNSDGTLINVSDLEVVKAVLEMVASI